MKVIFLSNDDADLQINLAAMVHSLDSCPVADLREGPGGPGPPLILGKKGLDPPLVSSRYLYQPPLLVLN